MEKQIEKKFSISLIKVNTQKLVVNCLLIYFIDSHFP